MTDGTSRLNISLYMMLENASNDVFVGVVTKQQMHCEQNLNVKNEQLG